MIFISLDTTFIVIAPQRTFASQEFSMVGSLGSPMKAAKTRHLGAVTAAATPTAVPSTAVRTVARGQWRGPALGVPTRG
jgi:hypothetical protein